MIKDTALKYLGYDKKQILSEEMEQLIDSCIQEVKETAQPGIFCRLFTLGQNPLRIEETGDEIPGEQMKELLENCDQCLLIGCTLGISIERKIKYYAKIDMTKAAIMDAVSSAYLEDVCDEYEEKLGYVNRTYRACPGYGDFPLEFNRRIAQILDIHKNLAVTITPDNLLIPQKSMLGLIGIGNKNRKKKCGTCIMKEDCCFRKRGQRCYENESEKIC